MSVKNLQDYIFTSKYSRFLPGKRRRETYEEAVDRVVDMHRRYFVSRGNEISDLLAEIRDLMLAKRVLGSQRALQFGGAPILEKHARIYNCTTSYCDRPRFFQEALWLLLCGCGVGFSVQFHHVGKLPALRRPQKGEVIHAVADSIEGWADALGALLSGYFETDQPFPDYFGHVTRFDYSAIRPKGAPITGGVGKAPGPEPLKRSLELIRVICDRVTAAGRGRLETIDAYDILMHASDAVLSGGVRRSATICMFSPDDEAMATAKTGNWFTENPQRARSNNSAMLIRGETTWEKFSALMTSVREYGEPGFVWADNREITFNPCAEIGLYPQIDGESGWAFCNLSEINIGAVDSEAAFAEAARGAAIIGTLQAAYTDFAYLGEVSSRIAHRESLLGVSMTGMMEHPDIAFNADLQKRMADVVLRTNAEVAARLGLPPAARTTCVKPSGTSSCLLGVSSGIHPHHARRYFRRAQANEDEAIVTYFRDLNPLAVEKSVWNPNGTDVVITFCVEASRDARVKRDLSALDLLEYVKLTKANWIDAGRRDEACAQPWLSHNVSNTITVKDDEWDEAARYIFDNRNYFAGVSLLPDGGDLDYPQAPFAEVWDAREIVDHYGVGAIMSSGLIVDGLHVFDDNLWVACDAALGRGDSLDFPGVERMPKRVREGVERLLAERADWVRRAEKFAVNYFDGDVLKMTRCLKRVHNCKLWEDLRREYTRVDYSLVIEDEDNTKLQDAVACVGGACEII
ncbi:MAG: hypothetical protein RRC34_07330 [Lentisphaeria bacterium]|nr:hypothetical protein [Lentisphaeria bacterium]